MVEKGTGLLVIISLLHTEKALKCFVSFFKKKKKKPISASEAKVNPSADSAGMRFRAQGALRRAHPGTTCSQPVGIQVRSTDGRSLNFYIIKPNQTPETNTYFTFWLKILSNVLV